MKIETKEIDYKTFKPFELRIQIETTEDLVSLYFQLYPNINIAKKMLLSEHKEGTLKERLKAFKTYELQDLFDVIDEKITELDSNISKHIS